MSDLAKRIVSLIAADVKRQIEYRVAFPAWLPDEAGMRYWEKWIDEEINKSQKTTALPTEQRIRYNSEWFDLDECDAADMPLTLEEQAVEDRSRHGK